MVKVKVGYKMVGYAWKKITRALAEEVRDAPDWRGERPIRQARIDLITSEILIGRAREFCWHWAYVGETELIYRVNGHHSSRAILAMKPFPTGLLAAWMEWECETMEDLALLYNSFDRSVGSRSVGDQVIAIRATNPQLIDINKNVLQSASSAIRYWEKRDLSGSRPTLSPDERQKIMGNNVEFMRFAQNLAGKKKGASRLRRLPVMAAMYGSFLRSRQESERFWTAVRDGVGLKEKDAPYLAREFLIDCDPGRGMQKFMAPDREVFVKMINAWNNYRDGKKKKNLVYKHDQKLPRMK